MPDRSISELEEFLLQQEAYFAAEYERVQRRVREDPNLAGAQAEENWAEMLRAWLPHTYHVALRGRVIAPNGETTPEVDVLVLHPSYPKYLLNKKYYLLGGVVAAFECKLSLRASHLPKIVATCARLKQLASSSDRQGGSGSVHCFPLFGVLAHSQLVSDRAFPFGWGLQRELIKQVSRASHVPDILCVADFATLYRDHSPVALAFGRDVAEDDQVDGWDDSNRERVSYTWAYADGAAELRPGAALAWFVKILMAQIASVDPSLERLRQHFGATITSHGSGGQYIILKPSTEVADEGRPPEA